MKRHLTRLAFLALTSVSMLGCKAKLNGSFTVNGQPFAPASCRSGEVESFTGVDFLDASGNKIRLVATPSGQPMVFYLPAGAQVATPIGTCGSLAITRTNSRINNIYNVEGQANLSCATPAGQVTGSVHFENCH